MLSITAKRCAQRFPGKRAAILGTTGTLQTGIYDRALKEAGVDFLLPDEAQQAWLMHLIYDVVKGGLPLRPEEPLWQTMLDSLRKKGADYFILACTELPILADAFADPGPYVDSTLELAESAIRFCGFKVRP
jgi:aspartate racemase